MSNEGTDYGAELLTARCWIAGENAISTLDFLDRSLSMVGMAGGYERDMAAYFDRQKKLSAAAGNAAIRLLTKASEG